MNNESGFTLIEAVVSLMIVGVLAALAGMSIVTGTKGYVQTRENLHLAQKAQVTMARVYRELMELTNIVAVGGGSEPWVIFDNPQGRQAIGRVGDTLRLYSLDAAKMNLDGETGDLLVDQIAGFSLSYFQGPITWTITDDIELLSAVRVGFDLQRQEGSQSILNFSTTVYPRNNNNVGGAPPPPESIPMTASQYACLITTSSSKIPLPDQARIGLWVVENLPTLLIVILSVITVYIARIPKKHKVLAVFLTGLLERRHMLEREKGNVLVGLVVTMLIFSALGAGMLSLTSSSTTGQVAANNDTKAYYVAESGFRYAASEFLNTNDTATPGVEDDRNRKLDELNGNTYNLSDNDGQFRLEIYPYFLTTQNWISDTTRAVKIPGSRPSNFTIPASGKIRINFQTYTYTSFSAYSATTGEFSGLSPGLPAAVPTDTTVKLVAIAPSGQPFVKNGDLNLTSTTADIFPELQGKFSITGIDDIKFGYIRREGSTLIGIFNADNPADDSFNTTLSASTDVIAEPFLQVRSIGTAGEGALAASRVIVYNTPLPSESPGLIKALFYDDFSDDSNLNTPTYGAFSTVGIGGDSALKVTTTQSSSLGLKSSLVSVNWTSTNVNFASAHKSTGRYLSYDAQAKLGVDSFPIPGSEGNWTDGFEDGTDPNGIPKYFMSGILFRLDQNLNTYGIGLTRGSTATDPTPDNIDNNLVPVDQVPLVALWQQTGDGTSRNWLAYSILQANVLLTNGAEDGEESVMISSDTWSRINQEFSGWAPAHTGEYGWKDTADGSNYLPDQNTDLQNPSNYLETLPLTITGESGVRLSFWHQAEIDDTQGDFLVVMYQEDGGTWNEVVRFTEQRLDPFQKETLFIDGLTGDLLKIRFFIVAQPTSGGQKGWWIDDIEITSRNFVDILDSADNAEITLMVRVIEAAVIDFTNGGTNEIEAGDTVTQSNGTVFGKVVFAPVLESGTSWAGGNAAGMLWLNKTSDTPFTGGSLYVGGSEVATVTNYKDRTNLIKVYFNSANPNDTDPPFNDAYDDLRKANGRGTLRWPANEGQITDDTNDHFTLLQWDPNNINTAVASPPEVLMDEKGRYSILSVDTLFSPSDTYFPVTRPELGLFALGHGATRIYFDDLGVQLYMISGSGFLQPVQQ